MTSFWASFFIRPVFKFNWPVSREYRVFWMICATIDLFIHQLLFRKIATLATEQKKKNEIVFIF